jgi:hypothetical protein
VEGREKDSLDINLHWYLVQKISLKDLVKGKTAF